MERITEKTKRDDEITFEVKQEGDEYSVIFHEGNTKITFTFGNGYPTEQDIQGAYQLLKNFR